ncbi:MAG: hypothetical protein WCS99_06465 [Limisphaerales bacterium]
MKTARNQHLFPALAAFGLLAVCVTARAAEGVSVTAPNAAAVKAPATPPAGAAIRSSAVPGTAGTVPAPGAGPIQNEFYYYRLETIPIPKNVSLEIGGMEFLPDGRLLMGTRRGEIWAFNKGEWKRWASGLDEVMGICPTGTNQVVVSQRPELTRITDRDGDGVADQFETLADAWNYSGHIYEWTFGPVRDSAGNFYGTLACWFFPTMRYERSPYSGWDIKPPAGWTPGTNTAWRGWCFQVTPRGEFIPWASGIRSPNGIGFNADGDLFVTDNQGEYFGACVMHHITKGAFHGHPNALFWGPDAVKDPFSIPLEEMDARRKLPAIQFPYGVMGQSAAQPLLAPTGGRFGPFAGQLFVGDQTKSVVMRVALEKVGGEYQGACFPFRTGFQCGNNRAAFAPDGSLWVGQTDRGWGAVGGQPFGLQRLVWTGETPFEIHSLRLTREGFDATFTKPVDPKSVGDLAAWSVQRFRYHYHRKYGSPKIDEQPVPVSAARVSADGRTVSLALGAGGLAPRFLYEFHLSGARAADGTELLHDAAYYTLNRLKE